MRRTKNLATTQLVGLQGDSNGVHCGLNVDVGYQTLCPKLVTTPHEPSILPRSKAPFFAPRRFLPAHAISGDAKLLGGSAAGRVAM